MKSYRKELFFEVSTRRAFINITPQGEKSLKESGGCPLKLVHRPVQITPLHTI